MLNNPCKSRRIISLHYFDLMRDVLDMSFNEFCTLSVDVAPMLHSHLCLGFYKAVFLLASWLSLIDVALLPLWRVFKILLLLAGY